MRRAMLIGTLSLAITVQAMAQTPLEVDERELGEHGYDGFNNSSYYRIKLGDKEISVICPSTLRLESCVAAALELMKGMPQ